ncbi:hypothetical protein BDN72DRAFT_905877 [Pluteus cervinus]|uniref:Uncharacterized protein n=1 Tax=Pluteus cervinus TaxID=181527 RepID=A0ACD3A1Y4_9AGAR|nr:hypothetical protein BDN72DRAFT_905877 [Pluteus cervinus]
MKHQVTLSLTLSQARALAAFLESEIQHGVIDEIDADIQRVLAELLIQLSFVQEDVDMDEDGFDECPPPTPTTPHASGWQVYDNARPSLMDSTINDAHNQSLHIEDSTPTSMDLDSPTRLRSPDQAGSPMPICTPQARYASLAAQVSPMTYAVFGAGSPCTPTSSRSPSLSPTLSKRTTTFSAFNPLLLAGQRRIVIQEGGNGGGGGGGGGAGPGVAIDWDPSCRRGARAIVAEAIQQVNQYPDQLGVVNQQQLDPYADDLAQQYAGMQLQHDAAAGSLACGSDRVRSTGVAASVGGYEHRGLGNVDSEDDEDNANDDGNQGRKKRQQVWDKTVQLPSSNIILGAPMIIVPVAERQALSDFAKTLITRVSMHFDRLLLDDPSLFNPRDVMDYLDRIFADQHHLSGQNELQGLAKVAHDCYAIEQMENFLRFMYMIKIITFRVGVHNEAAHNGQSRQSVLKELQKKGESVLSALSISTLERYIVEASKACLLLGAGSIYFVAMFAWAATKAELSGLTSTDAIRLAALIRCPDDSTHGKLIQESVIPGVDYLRRRYSFSLPSLYTELNRWCFDCPQIVDCTNIFATDALMDSLDYDSFVKGRDWEAWAPCLTPLVNHDLISIRQPAPLPTCSPPPLPPLPMPMSPPRFASTSALSTVFSIARPQRLALPPPQPLTSPPPLPPLPLNSPPPLPPQPLTSPPPLPPQPLTSPPPLPPQPPMPPPPLPPVSSTPDLFLIKTNFDPNHGVNKNIMFPRGDSMSQTKDRQEWTQKERDNVNKFKVVAVTGEELKAKIIKQLRSGCKQYYDSQGEAMEDQNYKAYVYAPNEVLRQSKVVRFNGRNKKLLAIVCTGLHDQIKSRLLRPLEAIFGDQLKQHNSFITPFDPFYSLHFSFYNRYSVKAPKKSAQQNVNVDPCTIQKKDKKKKANTAQFIPRASGEIRDHPAKYGAMQQMMAPVFTFIDKLVFQFYHLCLYSTYFHYYRLRSIYQRTIHKDLKEFVEALPGNAVSPASPFSGFVINLNAVTQAHRDWNDQSICVVTVISDPDCEGGELVLVEPGLVLDLKCGDMVIFPSSQLSHFNLHFKGIRASVVCHSDKYATSWLADRNGWQYYPLFKTQRGRKAGAKGVGKASVGKSSTI